MKLSIIVLSYNTKELTTKCIDSILSQYNYEIKKRELEVIVVDNASSDGTLDSLKKFRSIKIIENPQNFGFSKGNNIGAKRTKGEFILFLNSDTQIKDKGFLKMTEFFNDKKDVGILGGKLINPDGSAQPSCGKFYTFFNFLIMILGLERLGLLRLSPNNVKKVDWVSGACFMVRKNLFEKLKGFDEYFFMYIEDMELCFRAKKQGFLTYFHPNIKLVHKELGSSNRAFAIGEIYRGLLYFYKKHMNYTSFLLVKILLILKALVAIILGRKDYRLALRFAI